MNAPYGYTLNENYYEVNVDSNTAYQMDGTSGDVIIEIAYENHPVKGELNIVKQGEVLNGYKDDFTYQKETLEEQSLRYMLPKIFIQQISRKMIMETVSWSMLLGNW